MPLYRLLKGELLGSPNFIIWPSSCQHCRRGLFSISCATFEKFCQANDDRWYFDITFICTFLNTNVLVTVLIAAFTGSRVINPGVQPLLAFSFSSVQDPSLRVVPPTFRAQLTPSTSLFLEHHHIHLKDVPTNAQAFHRIINLAKKSLKWCIYLSTLSLMACL